MTTTPLAAKRSTLVLVAVGAAVLLALGVILGRRAHKGIAEPGGPKRLVVLPFKNLWERNGVRERNGVSLVYWYY
jgi:hypothetical protein